MRFSICLTVAFFPLAVQAQVNDNACKQNPLLSKIKAQAPSFMLPSEVDQPATPGKDRMKFSPIRLLRAAKGQEICIAVLVDEKGISRDTAVYAPRSFALAKDERKALLTPTYFPAIKAGQAVPSIVVVSAKLGP